MRTRLSGFGALALVIAAVAIVVPARAGALDADAEVTFAPLARSYEPPAIRGKQGWLSVSNRDWQPYTVVIEKKGRASLYRGGQSYPGMQCFIIPSGATTTLALEKDTWEFRGNNNDELDVKVREGRTSTLSLEPFGPMGRTGLRGVSNDGDKVRTRVLFDNYYAPPVVVSPPTVIVPPPPPVIVHRPPIIVHRPPVIVHHPPVVVHRPPHFGGRRPPPHRRDRDRDRRPDRKRGNDNGLGIILDLFD